MTYRLMLSRDCGIHYNVAYETEDRNDPTLRTKMEEAAAKVQRFYLEGDPEVLCPLHAHAVELFGGSVSRGPYATSSMEDKVSRLTRAWKG